MVDPGQPVLEADQIGVKFTSNTGDLLALHEVSFSVKRQEFLCLLGPSGSGKTTLLRVIAGLIRPTEGKLVFPGSKRLLISIVFQQSALIPWRSAIDNVSLPLELKGIPRQTARERAADAMQRMGLCGFEYSWPRDLSGGMAQRVALARALIQNPDLLLLDEPFGSLDALTREKMGAELLELWQNQRTTVLMVTHSISEALLLGDRVLVFSPRPGKVIVDLPVSLPRPRTEDTRYTAEFNQLAKQLKQAIQ
ncbi:MAG TPA: ABC transporter ATP-binding protein [Longilinea sp.]|nr:ABC transporter ATP-binding protein [Longilinea sp.]